MAQLNIDSGITLNPNDQNVVDQVKKQQIDFFIEKFGDKYPITQKLISYGQPRLGVKLDGSSFIIRTSAQIPEEDVEAIRLKIASDEKL